MRLDKLFQAASGEDVALMLVSFGAERCAYVIEESFKCLSHGVSPFCYWPRGESVSLVWDSIPRYAIFYVRNFLAIFCPAANPSL
jgi:hypothetical protein